MLGLLVAISSCGGAEVHDDTGIPRAGMPDPEQQEVLALVAEACRVSAEGRVWRGYDVCSYKLLVVLRDGDSLLVDNREAGWPEFAGLHYRVLEDPGESLRRSRFVTSIQVEGKEVFALSHFRGEDAAGWYALLVHEVFHKYQRDHFTPTAPRPCRYPYNCLNLDGLDREGQVLVTALAAEEDQAAELLQKYVALRQQRRATELGGAAARVEDYEERLEGSARFVEIGFMVSAGFLDPAGVILETKERLEILRLTEVQKWRYYSTGHALLLLAAAAGLDFAGGLEGGKAPFGLFDKGGEPQAAQLQAPTPECQAALGIYLFREREALERWSKQGEVRYLLTLPKGLGSFYSNSGPTFALEDCRLFVSGVQVLVDNGAGLTVNKRSVALDNSRQDTYVVEFYGSRGTLLADGAEASGQDGRIEFGQSIELTGEGFSLKHNGRGAVETSGSELRITLEPVDPSAR